MRDSGRGHRDDRNGERQRAQANEMEIGLNHAGHSRNREAPS